MVADQPKTLLPHGRRRGPSEAFGAGWEDEGVSPRLSLRRELRKNTTDAEKKLWRLLRSEGFNNWRFRRQHAVGNYIADFACPELLLIIEADGGQHNENKKDAERTAWLEAAGWTVLRFWNNEILQNLNGVAEVLWKHLETASLHRGRKKISVRKTRYSEIANTLTRSALPSDLSHEGEVNGSANPDKTLLPHGRRRGPSEAFGAGWEDEGVSLHQPAIANTLTRPSGDLSHEGEVNGSAS